MVSPDDISTARMAQIIASAPEDGAEGRRSRKFPFKLGVEYLSNDIKEREKNEKKNLEKLINGDDSRRSFSFLTILDIEI